jgi:hypothetical protein
MAAADYPHAASFENGLGLHYSRFRVLASNRSIAYTSELPKTEVESAKLG